MELRELFRRRRAAEVALEDPALIEAFATLRAKAHAAFEASSAHDIEAREEAHQRLRVLKAIESELAAMIADHELAKRAETARTASTL